MKIYNELESLGFFEWLSETHNLKDTDMTPKYLDELLLDDIHRSVCNSMAFRWFREKCGLYSWITMELGNKSTFCWVLSGEHTSTQYAAYFYTYEEAEEACINKLIEIVKESV